MTALANEARAILEGVSAEEITVRQDAQGYLVAARFTGEGFDGQAHAGHTAIDPATSADPRDLACRLIILSRENAAKMASRKSAVDAYDSPEAVATEEPTFTPENDPFGPPIEIAAAIELAEDSAHESNGETGEAQAVEGTEFRLVPTDPEGDAGVVSGDSSGLGRNANDVGEWLSNSEAPFDADFEDTPDLGSELLDDEAFAVPELEAPPPEDFAPDEIEPEPEHAAGAFIFGDNLAHDRIIRIGQLSEHANTLIDAAKVGYSDAEHDAVRSHVVSNLNEAGAYVGGNQALFDRFIELESLTARVRRIEIYRDQRQDFIRSADREAVASFEPETGWP